MDYMEGKYCVIEKEPVMTKEEIAAYSLENGGLVLYPEGVKWNDGVERHFQVDFRKLFDAPPKFRRGIVYEIYKKIMEQEIPEGYLLKVVGIPAAATTATTHLNDRYGIPAARLRKEPFVFKEEAEKYREKIGETRNEKTHTPLKYFKKYMYCLGYDWLANHYEHRATASSRNGSRGKKDLLEEGSLIKGDALWLLDNVSSKKAKSKVLSCELIDDEAESRNLVKGVDYRIEGSIVVVSNSPIAKKIHHDNGLKYVYLWETPAFIEDIRKGIESIECNKTNLSGTMQEKISAFKKLYPVIVSELEDLGWNAVGG